MLCALYNLFTSNYRKSAFLWTPDYGKRPLNKDLSSLLGISQLFNKTENIFKTVKVIYKYNNI